MCVLVNYKEKALICSKTGKLIRPSCFDDLMTYHSYLSERHPKRAKTILKDVLEGKSVITDMIKYYRG